MANKNLNAAKTAKKDEFYTQMIDIERELQHYWPHFRDKVVLCNCDDPYESNFFKYFALRFNQLGLKKLICTCYNGSPVQGNELMLDFGDFTEDPKKIAYKVEITEVRDLNGWRNIVLGGVATSIDALAVGAAQSMDEVSWHAFVPLLVSVFVITALSVVVGIRGGRAIGARFGRWAEIAGGLVLIGIGVSILL